MSTSDIAVTALTAVPTVKGNALTITTSDPRNGALPNIALDHVDIYASQTDTFASASVVTQGTLRAIHADAGEEQTWYYWGIPYDKIGGAGTRYPAGATGGVACVSLGQVGLAFVLSNGKLVATVAANALTIAVKTAAGNDPSASDPVYVAFPNATLTSGNYQVRAITAALSVTVSSGSTLGLLAGSLAFKLWVVLFDDAGTLRLGVCLRSYQGGVILPLSDGAIASSTAEGAAGGADGTLIYTTTAVTSKPYRILGYLEWNTGPGLTTPGTWDAAPDVVRLAAIGTRPGAVLQEFGYSDGSAVTTTSIIPSDGTTPQIGEGGSWTSGIVMTPQSAANWFEFDAELNASHSVASELLLTAFRDGAANAIGSGVSYAAVADKLTQIRVKFRILAGSLSARTFSFNYGPAVAGTMTINGSGGVSKLNGTLFSSIAIKEIAG